MELIVKKLPPRYVFDRTRRLINGYYDKTKILRRNSDSNKCDQPLPAAWIRRAESSHGIPDGTP
jgi:hypothetical protein